MTSSKSHVLDYIGNLQDLLKKHNDSGCGKLHLIGHEKKDWLIVKWNIGDKTKIGLYNYPDGKFQEMLSLKGNINVIQASINQNLSLISFVTRSSDDVYSVMLSQPWSYLKQKVTQVASWTPSKKKIDLIQQSKLQSMSQFVNQKIRADSDEEEEEEDIKSSEENHKLLIFVHHK